MELTVADKFSPGIANEGKDYLLPEDQVVMEAELRMVNSDIKKLEYRQGPLYLASCYDEFSRHYLTVNVARNAPSTIPLINTDLDYGNFIDDSQATSGILQYYHPGYAEWNSTFKKMPPDSRHLLSGKVVTDTNLVIKMKNIQMGQKPFEPLTGSMCIYVSIGEELCRITECMHFDATPENIRKQYAFAYTDSSEAAETPKTNDAVNLSGSSVNVADASGSNSHMCMFNVTVPEELRGGDIFLVAQLSKILSTDADKAVAPYYARASPVELDKHRQSCMRLAKFRQPIALGIAKINDCFKNSKSEVKCQMYAQKACVNDAFIAQSVKELYQRDNNTPYNRMEPLDMEMVFTMHDLGRQVQMENSMKIQGLSVSMSALDPTNSMKNVPTSGYLVPKIIPSQIQSDQAPLVYQKDVTNLEHLGKNSSKLVIRQAMPLLPPLIAKEITRQFKTGVDNTIFVYPLQMEKFQNRNLCLKIELIELKATTSVTTKTILSAPYGVLPNVYNYSIVGPLFSTEAYSRISYHVKNPVLTDEFKIRLPDILNGRHWLRFTVLHMHVKPIAGRNSLLSNFVRSSVDKIETDSIEVGIGMLPLMVNGGECLLEDKEYTITMGMPNSDVPSAELPILRFRTKTMTSLVSSDSKVQAVFRHHPQPLGSLPSSIMTVETATELLQQGNPNLSVTRLVITTQELSKASPSELSKHFLVVMRQLLRTLIAGPGVYDEQYCNPYKHTKARSQAFLTLLQVVGKIATDSNAPSSTNELSQEKEFLNAYVDFLFDEELPIRTSPALMPTMSAETMLLLKGNGKDVNGRASIRAKRPSGESFASPRTGGEESVSVDEVKIDVSGIKNISTPPTGRNIQDFAAISISSDRRERPVSVGSLASVASAVTASSASGSMDNDTLPTESTASSNKGKFIARSGRKSTSPATAGNGKVPPVDLSRVSAAASALEWVSEVNNEESSNSPRGTEDPAENGIAADDGDEANDEVLNDDNLVSTEYLPTSIDSTGEQQFDAVRNSADRKSWGKFITDAMWSSGKLQSLAIVAGGGEHHEVGEAYLDDIANHIILQAERIVIERLVSVAAMAMVSLVRYNSEIQCASKFQDVVEQSVLAGKRFRVSKNLTSYQNLMPFEDEKTWFAALDSGETFDDSQISLRSASPKPANSRKPIRSKENSRSSIYIQPILPRYDTIDGYRERAANHELAMAADESIGPNSDHWWPWMYEVIVYQWGAVLAIILSNSNLISSNNIESITGSFPFEFEYLKQMEGQRETRPLLMEHGPMLLRMMFKSLSMRIVREHKRPPVILDDQFLNALENLVMLLAVESVSFKTGLWKSRKLVSSLANFLRSLFALVAPAQVVRLLRTFFRAVRKNKPDVEAGELRLQMIEEISLFDHIIAVNFPFTLDAPLDMFSFNIADALLPVKTIQSVTYSATGFRSALNLPANSLAHMIIGEVFSLYRQEEAKIKRAALEVLRDLLVRHTCDARFQDADSQQRIVCMYLPLMKEILEDVDSFSSQRNDSVDRREMLAMLLYVVQNIPERILRHRIRNMCIPPVATTTPNTSPRPDRKKTMSVVSLKMTPTTQGFSSNFIQKSSLQQMPIYNLISALHLILDTFEVPKVTAKNDVMSFVSLLSPAVSVIARDGDDSNTTSLPLSNRRVTIEGSGNTITPKSNVATSLLAKLDQQMQTRKSTTATRKLSTGVAKGEDRKWLEHAKQMAENSVKERTTLVSKKAVVNASKQLCYSSTKTVMGVLTILFEECPMQLMATANKADIAADTSDIFVLRDSNIDESVVTGIKDLRIIEFMKVALSVILHGLYCNQEDEAIIDLFTCAVSVIRQFGAKIFLVSVEDSLQDWMRTAFFHCASSSDQVRDAGSNFILYLLQSCYHYLGSITLISNTILAVVNDVLAAVLESQAGNIQVHSDEDRALLGLDASISEMKSVALQNYNQTCTEISGLSTVTITSTLAPFYYSVNKLMSDLEIVLRANAELRRFVSHPVSYDYLGANFLDGPFDDRCSSIIQQTRMQRKSVRPDSRSVSNVFQLEEVMMHIVQAAEVYDPIKLPRFRMQWLENLARLHEMRGNRAEGAEIRWRIFQICQMVEDTWQMQWVPRPPLDWSRRGSSPLDAADSTKADKKFFNVFLRAMDSRPSRAWISFQQYLTHMITALAVATERFCNISLIHLAERSSTNLIQLYRLSKQNELLLTEYGRISTAVKTMIDKGITNAMALGTFYRVFYDGQGVPTHLRGKEFIFRNANHLHVSEFQSSVVSHLKSIVADVVEVKVVNDISSVEKNLADPNTAYMVMNSVKLNVAKNFKLSTRSAAGSNKRPVSFGNRLAPEHKTMEAMNQVISFQYSVPFTKDPLKAHSKRIDEQWMRMTTLTVKEPFPYILTRQLVFKRETKDFSPIEVSMNDIDERVEAMEAELEKVGKNASDNNNLMRIVQGSIMPQVNAGAAEVAKVFLSPHKILSDTIQAQLASEGAKMNSHSNSSADLHEEQKMKTLVIRLKSSLLDFLICSKLLLAKTRRVLITELQDISLQSDVVAPNKAMAVAAANKKAAEAAQNGITINTGPDPNNVIWQTEMERGFEALVQAIWPYVQDIADADQFNNLK